MIWSPLLWFLLIYGVGRAATDFLRGDTEGPLYLGVLSLTQLLSVAAGAGALTLLVAHVRKANHRAELPTGLCRQRIINSEGPARDGRTSFPTLKMSLGIA